MEIYNNDYSKQEDAMLWELHEIRHKLQQKYSSMSVAEINDDAKSLLEDWKNRRTIQPITK